ncbi:MAG: thioether cross-link-forming SCIFF peptide maturase [Clostridiales bacterium]|nr:thioether cross-link-forming SCIFF peptide maturase [Clostridiales bacterium]
MIHKFDRNGIFFVMDVNSGAVHALDETAYRIVEDVIAGKSDEELLAAWSECPKEETLEAAAELRELAFAGQLGAEEIEGLYSGFEGGTVVKALCLHIAHDCNLRCEYCFASKGEYKGERQLMTKGVARRAVDFLIESSGHRRNLEIDFFGGEPTMNFDVVKDCVEYGRMREAQSGKRIRFTITTNGLLLDREMMEYINENMQNVVLSLDGRKSVNDAMRKTVSGSGSYGLIASRLKEMADMRGQKSYYVRGTYTRRNLDFSEDVLHMADLGFKQISVEPVVADPKEDWSLREEDLPALFAEYEKLSEAMIKRGEKFNFFHFMINLQGGPCAKKRVSGCGAGSEYLAVTPTGDLYPCHQFVGIDELKLGSLETGVINLEKSEMFSKRGVLKSGKCASCWSRFYCGGGCAASAYLQNGNLDEPYAIGCELQKKRVECAIYLASKEA